MKIALTLLSGVGYGGLTYFKNLIPALAANDRENEYHLFVPQGHPLVGRVKQENFVFHRCVKSNQSALKRFLWEQLVLPRELKKYKVDILFTAKNLNVFLASCKTVISLRNMEPLAYREYDNDRKFNAVLWLKWQLTKWSVRKADHIVAVSQAVKDRAMRCFPRIEKKVSVVYNGNPVPLSVILNEAPAPEQSSVRGFTPRSEGSRAYARNLAFARDSSPTAQNDNNAEFLLSASKFVAYANQLNLLRGYAKLVEKNPDTPPLWLAGGVHDKKYFQKVQKFVQDNKLEDRVKFLGLVPHDHLLELMRQARAFVFPSTLESCPHTLIEAMACGVPIVTSNMPPMPEICADAAIYFDPYDPNDIAKAIEHMMYDETVRSKLRNAGPTRSLYFTWDKTAKGLVNVFESL